MQHRELARFSHCANCSNGLVFCITRETKTFRENLKQFMQNGIPRICLLLQAAHSRRIGRGLYHPFDLLLFFGLLCKEAFSHGVEQCIAQAISGRGFSAGCLDIDGDVFDVDHDLLSFAVK